MKSTFSQDDTMESVTHVTVTFKVTVTLLIATSPVFFLKKTRPNPKHLSSN